MLFSVLEYINDASQSVLEEKNSSKIVKIDRNAEHPQLRMDMVQKKRRKTLTEDNVLMGNCWDTLTHSWTNVQIYPYKQIWHKRMFDYICKRKIDTNKCLYKYLWPMYWNIWIFEDICHTRFRISIRSVFRWCWWRWCWYTKYILMGGHHLRYPLPYPLPGFFPTTLPEPYPKS